MATIVTKDDITKALTGLGIAEGDTVLVHSALRSVGKIEGSAQTVIDAIEGIIGKEGTLVMPTFSQVDFTNSYKTWYMDKPSDTGYLTEYFRKLPFVYRSNQETHSVAARGKLAYELTYQHKWFGPHICHYGEYAFADSSPWKKMYDMNAKVLFFGVTMAHFTFKHMVESRAVEYFLSQMKGEAREKFKNGLATPETIYDAEAYWMYYSSAKMQPVLTELGLVKEAPCGDATLYLVNAKDACEKTYEIIMSEPTNWFGPKAYAHVTEGIEASKNID